MLLIRAQGKILVQALPQEAIIANIVRRTLKIVREEYDLIQFKQFDDSQATSLHKLVTQNSETDQNNYSTHQTGLKDALIEHLLEIESELDTSYENLASQAPEHIHSSELVLTLGHSKSVELFLKSAAKKRKFEVVVAECAPNCRGHMMAASLAKVGIETTIIPDSAIFAIMSRVNKVIIGTHSVLANGGLRAASGSFSVALAAKHYSVPVVVLVPMFKLSPVFLCNFEQEAFNLFGCAEGVLPYSNKVARDVKVYSPVFDYVPPELVTLFISNALVFILNSIKNCFINYSHFSGGNAPSYIYRLLTEMYNTEDYDLNV